MVLLQHVPPSCLNYAILGVNIRNGLRRLRRISSASYVVSIYRVLVLPRDMKDLPLTVHGASIYWKVRTPVVSYAESINGSRNEKLGSIASTSINCPVLGEHEETQAYAKVHIMVSWWESR